MTSNQIHTPTTAGASSLYHLRTFDRHAITTLLVLLLLVLISPGIHANPLDGLLTVHGSYFGSSNKLTGYIDTAAGTLQFNPSGIYGVTATFPVAELLAPGTYTRTFNLSAGGSVTRSATIPAGKLGAYYVVAHNGYEYQVFNAWTVSPDGLKYSNYDIAGNVLQGGALNGSRLTTAFSTSANSLHLSVDIVGGLAQQCSATGGSTVTAIATISGGTAVDRVEWTLDGQYQGTGLSKSLFIPLGGATVEATAFATDGVTTDTQSSPVSITDKVGPVIDIEFTDGGGNPVTTAQAGDYTIHLAVSDVCDPAPVSSGSAKPVMHVVDGDIITINATNDVRLPTTAVEVTAEATDASGNKTVTLKVLGIQ